ncbi:MAG: hypothetical protein M0Z39_06495 [Actinomycetota bacterium]|nr:hypothetical protein [Actinomycetota bacterium]
MPVSPANIQVRTNARVRLAERKILSETTTLRDMPMTQNHSEVPTDHEYSGLEVNQPTTWE